MIGQTLAHYKILEKIGQGGMGEVYLAEDTKLDRKVALKVLPPELAESEERRARFEREAKALAALNHPNIITVYSVEQVDDVHFITMELVKGKTLAELIPKRGMELEKFFQIAIPLADAVAAAHEEGIIHRDLKPGNVMVTDDVRVKVLDFGLARPARGFTDSEGRTAAKTKEGVIVGTVAYMSPEQAEGKKTDHRSDNFSLGIILYELATGEHPFKGDTTASMLSSILRDTPTSATEVNPRLPHDLGKIIRRCLVKDVERRYQTAKDLRNELEELKQDLGSGEVVEGVISTKPIGTARWISLVVVALMAAAVTAYVLRAPATTPPSPVVTRLTQLTAEAGVEHFPSLSPDGDSIVYDGQASGNRDIYLQRVGGQRAINLTEDSIAFDTHPAFSPDGTQIAFCSGRDGGGLFLMGATGESVKRLTESGFNPAWSPDGASIVFSTRGRSNSISNLPANQLRVVRIDTEEIRAIDIEGEANQPHWSPHGHRIAFWSTNLSERNHRDIGTVPADGGAVVALTRDEHVDWNPVWSPDGNYIYFSSNRGGTMSLWRVAVEEETGKALGDPELVSASEAARIGHLSITRDGRRVAYRADVGTRNIEKISFNPDSESVAGEPVSITRGSRWTSAPAPSPDGRWLAFETNPGGGQGDIGLVGTDGTGLRLLTNAPHHGNYGPRWSPDGSRLSFYSARSGDYEIWTIQSDGSNLTRLTDTPYRAHVAVWSPDGSRIAYQGGDASHVVFVATAREEQTPQALPPFADGGYFRVMDWSPDGEKLAGFKAPDSVITIYSVHDQKYHVFPVNGTHPRWMSDSRRLIYRSRGRIHLLDTMTAEHHEVLSIAPDFVLNIDVSRDDRWIYFARATTEADIWMLTFEDENP